MEGLNLGDLEFDESSLNLFDTETGLQDPKDAGATPTAGDATPPDNTGKDGDDKTNTGSDDTAGGGNTPPAGQESVANQGKDNNQVQAGKTSDGKEGSDSSSPKLNETEQLYSNLAAEFQSKGVLPGLDIAKVKSLEDIQEAIKNQIESSLTDRQKLIEDAQKTGAPVSEVMEKTDTIDKLKRVTPEYMKDERNLPFRRTAIVQDALTKGYSKERAEVMAQRSIDAGTDIEDANEALASLIKTEETSLQGIISAAKKKEDDNLNNIKNYISTTPEVIPGISLTDSQKDELYNQITTDVGNNESAFEVAQKADPISMRIKIEALHYLTGGFKDFSIFGTKQETKITNNIENLLRGANFTGGGTVDTNVSDDNSNFKLSDLKDLEIE